MPESDFTALIEDIANFQQCREVTPIAPPRFAKAMAPARARPALNLSALAVSNATLARRNAELARDAASIRTKDILAQALAANAAGLMTATQVSRLEGAAHRAMAAFGR